MRNARPIICTSCRRLPASRQTLRKRLPRGSKEDRFIGVANASKAALAVGSALLERPYYYGVLGPVGPPSDLHPALAADCERLACTRIFPLEKAEEARSIDEVKPPSLLSFDAFNRAICYFAVGLPVQRHANRKPSGFVGSNYLNARHGLAARPLPERFKALPS
jgi:hypothetical protein